MKKRKEEMRPRARPACVADRSVDVVQLAGVIGIGVLAGLSFPMVVHAQATLASTAVVASSPSFDQIATFLFVMLGPIKVLGPFAGMARGMDKPELQKFALIGVLISLGAVAAAATIGVSLLEKWAVSHGALLMAGGIFIFLAGIGPILRQLSPPAPPPAPVAPAEKPARPPLLALALKGLVFPTIVTPQGVALVILTVAAYPALTGQVVLSVVGIMVINFVAMLFAQSLLKTPGVLPALIVVGSVIGVLQVGLGVQIVINGLRVVGALAPLG
jgi:multiple antibiotic resistance protein